MQFKNSIRFYRRKLGLKQAELADRLKIKRPTLSFIENGYRLPNIKLLEEIASNLNANIGLLYPTDVQDLIIKYGDSNN
jgi:transcriptional regulator with XRE-family HTH domain